MYYDMPTNNPQPKKSNALAIIIAIVVILCGGCFGAMYTGVIDGAKFGIVNHVNRKVHGCGESRKD